MSGLLHWRNTLWTDTHDNTGGYVLAKLCFFKYRTDIEFEIFNNFGDLRIFELKCSKMICSSAPNVVFLPKFALRLWSNPPNKKTFSSTPTAPASVFGCSKRLHFSAKKLFERAKQYGFQNSTRMRSRFPYSVTLNSPSSYEIISIDLFRFQNANLKT